MKGSSKDHIEMAGVRRLLEATSKVLRRKVRTASKRDSTELLGDQITSKEVEAALRGG